MFIYCFEKKDKEDLISKGYRYLKEETVGLGDKKAYVFIDDNKLNFEELDNKKFIKSNKMNF